MSTEMTALMRNMGVQWRFPFLLASKDRERKTGKVLPDWCEEFTRPQQEKEYRRLIQEGEQYISEVLAAIDRN